MKNMKSIAGIIAFVAMVASGTIQAQDTSTLDAVTVKATVTAPVPDTARPSAKLPLLLDLGATKCKACKELAPILEELAKDYAGQLNVEFVDVWQKENAARAEQYKIKTIPTQIFFAPDGRELFRHVGFFSKEDILAKWKELGFTFMAPANSDTNTVSR